jgi:trehalose 6-phosphate synthase
MPVLSSGGRRVRVGTYPASINVDWFASISSDPSTAAAAADLRVQLGSPQRVLLGVDRLDYTKGIDARLEAFRAFVVENKLRPSDVTMVQVAVPSREDVGAYETERQKIEQLVGEINGDHGEVGAPLVHYLYRSVDQRELVALYRAADIMLVTPFRDGMNLVAKEYVSSRVDNDGVLVLSEFAAASRELQAALQVNPHDRPGMVEAISKAVWMPERERRQRMRRMRRSVGAWTAQDWAEAFLSDLAAQGERQRTTDGQQRGHDPL